MTRPPTIISLVFLLFIKKLVKKKCLMCTIVILCILVLEGFFKYKWFIFKNKPIHESHLA